MATEYEPDPTTPGAHILHLPNGQSVRTASPISLLEKSGARRRMPAQPGLQQLDRLGYVNQPQQQGPEFNPLGQMSGGGPNMSVAPAESSQPLPLDQTLAAAPNSSSAENPTPTAKVGLKPVNASGAPAGGGGFSLGQKQDMAAKAAAEAYRAEQWAKIGKPIGGPARRLPAQDVKVGHVTRVGPQVTQEMLDQNAELSIDQKLQVQEAGDAQEAAFQQQARDTFAYERLPALKREREEREKLAALEEKQAKVERQRQNLLGLRQDYQHKLDTKEIDPGRLMSNMTTGARIVAAIGAFFGGLGGNSNPTLDFISNAIEQDIAAQRADLEKTEFQLGQVDNELARLVDHTGDIDRAQDLLFDLQLAGAQAKLKELGLRAQGNAVQGKVDELLLQLDAARTERTQAMLMQAQGETTETYKHKPARTTGGYRTYGARDYLKATEGMRRAGLLGQGPQAKVDPKQRDAAIARRINFPDGTHGYAASAQEAVKIRNNLASNNKVKNVLRELDKIQQQLNSGKINELQARSSMSPYRTAAKLYMKEAFNTGALDAGSIKELNNFLGGLGVRITADAKKSRAKTLKQIMGADVQTYKGQVYRSATGEELLLPPGVKVKE